MLHDVADLMRRRFAVSSFFLTCRARIQLLRDCPNARIVVLTHFKKEPRRSLYGGFSLSLSDRGALGFRQIQPTHRSRQRDKAQPPLLLQSRVLALLQRARRRKNALRQTTDEANGKFEPLCRVDGHEPYRVRLFLALRGFDGDLLQVQIERIRLAPIPFARHRRTLQLRQVVKPLHAAVFADVLLVSGLCQHFIEDRGRRHRALAAAQFLHGGQ